MRTEAYKKKATRLENRGNKKNERISRETGCLRQSNQSYTRASNALGTPERFSVKYAICKHKEITVSRRLPPRLVLAGSILHPYNTLHLFVYSTSTRWRSARVRVEAVPFPCSHHRPGHVNGTSARTESPPPRVPLVVPEICPHRRRQSRQAFPPPDVEDPIAQLGNRGRGVSMGQPVWYQFGPIALPRRRFAAKST